MLSQGKGAMAQYAVPLVSRLINPKTPVVTVRPLAQRSSGFTHNLRLAYPLLASDERSSLVDSFHHCTINSLKHLCKMHPRRSAATRFVGLEPPRATQKMG